MQKRTMAPSPLIFYCSLLFHHYLVLASHSIYQDITQLSSYFCRHCYKIRPTRDTR